MIFVETKLPGAYLIKPERHEDERGYNAETFCQKEFVEHGLNPNVVQCSVSFNQLKGTFRGMHFQAPPYQQEKLVTCLQGAALDYIVDLRPNSPTFKEYIKVELSQENGFALYIPKSFAHGFLTLHDNTLLMYQMSEYHHDETDHGFRWDDPAFDISLPFKVTNQAENEKNYPDLYVLPVLSDYEIELKR
ncbi:MAG: dTDP-4-dehydrorhamnose 3,5-epimerase family protein [Bacteroidota bacterium]